MADSADSSPLRLAEAGDRLRILTAQQEFRLRIARNDLERVADLDMVGTEVTGLALMAGALGPA
ncbi:hypothetical protein GXW82_34610 [Streptacidiphilus sp. 4-A2]|nr:hypothetical protein [Streptacidiphilus sp. 4-A2]